MTPGITHSGTAMPAGAGPETSVSATVLDLTDDGRPARPERLVAELADLVTVILGYAELLDAALPDSSTERDDVDAIVTGASRAAAVVTRLMAGVAEDTAPSAG